METRHRGVLVDEPARSCHLLSDRVAEFHRVDDAHRSEARWRYRKAREDEDADESGDDHGVAHTAIGVSTQYVQVAEAPGQDQPVAPDIDEVEDTDQRAQVIQERLLQSDLPVEAENGLDT